MLPWTLKFRISNSRAGRPKWRSFHSIHCVLRKLHWILENFGKIVIEIRRKESSQAYPSLTPLQLLRHAMIKTLGKSMFAQIHFWLICQDEFYKIIWHKSSKSVKDDKRWICRKQRSGVYLGPPRSKPRLNIFTSTSARSKPRLHFFTSTPARSWPRRGTPRRGRGVPRFHPGPRKTLCTSQK